MKEKAMCPDESLHVQDSTHLGVIGVRNAMCDIQEYRNAISVACSTALREHLQQALSSGWGERRQLQYFQRMPGYLIAIPALHVLSAGGYMLIAHLADSR